MRPWDTTPGRVQRGFEGFFVTPRMGAWIVRPGVGWLTCAFLYRRPEGRKNRSILGFVRVKVRARGGRLGEHILPGLPLGRARLDDGEHLILRDAAHLRQGHREPGGLVGPALLDRAGQVASVDEGVGDGVGRPGAVRLGSSLLLCLELLAELTLLDSSGPLRHLGPMASDVPGVIRSLVDLANEALAGPLLGVEPRCEKS